MHWEFLLGILFTLVTGIIANLLTPLAPPLWRKVLIWQQHGQHAQVRQRLKVAQGELDLLSRRRSGSDRELFLYLLRWLLSIVALFALAAACVFIAATSPDVAAIARQRLLLASLVCLVASIVLSIFLLLECGRLTEAGLEKRTSALKTEIARLVAKLPSHG